MLSSDHFTNIYFTWILIQVIIVLGRCPQATLHLSCHISYVTPPIGKFLSILEFGRHKLFNAHGLTLMTSSLCGWEVFPMPGAFTHTKTTWPLLSMVPQFLGVIPGFLLYPCCGKFAWKGAQL